MLKAFEPFLKPERLMESLHGCSTQCNEAMNQSIAKYAPKNKSYGSTMSLSNRVAIAVGVFNYGHEKFWKEVYSDIGMTMTSTLSLHLQMKDRKIEKRRENEKKPSVKLRRAQKQIERTNQLMEMERKDREKGATYGTGIAITIIVPDEVRKKENELKKMLGSRCENFGCYASGHKTKKSKKCKYHTFKTQKEADDESDRFMRLKYPRCYQGKKQVRGYSFFVFTIDYLF